MPQYHLDTDGAVSLKTVSTPAGSTKTRWEDLDAFTQGYIQAMFFTNECSGVSTDEFLTYDFQERMHEGQSDGVLPGDVGFSELHPDTLAEIMQDCADFQRNAAPLLEQAYEMDRPRDGFYGPESAGMDYWYNTVGHGVGFWDRGLGVIGDALDSFCQRKDLNPFFQDGKVYLEG